MYSHRIEAPAEQAQGSLVPGGYDPVATLGLSPGFILLGLFFCLADLLVVALFYFETRSLYITLDVLELTV